MVPIMNNSQLTKKLSPSLWKEAEELLTEQERLRQELASAMTGGGLPTSTGLYPDERRDDFPSFVQHVRKVLSRSPRTMLRQAVNAAFDDEKGSEQSEDLKALRRVLQLTPEATVLMIAQATEKLTQGKRYCRLEKTKQQLDVFHRYESRVDLRDKIACGLKVKRGSTPTSKEIEQAVDQVTAKQEERRKRLQEQASRLEKELADDLEYERFCQATELWKHCGGEKLWRNYKSVDLAISKRRGTRGSHFEAKSSDIVFAMIVTQLSKEEPGGRKWDDYWYQRGLFCWHAGQAVGELDVVVFHKGQVVAVCEMKSSCFEIAAAPRQHQAKLAAVANSHHAWAIGPTAEEAVGVSGQTIPLFLATILPNGQKGEQVGVEPSLANTICRGIRLQGKHIAHATNVDLCLPLIDMLKGESCDDAIKYLDSLPSSPRCPHDENDLDYEELRCFVLGTMGAEQLVESPLGCLERFPQHRMLVLPRI